ncbi:selenium-dependent molybdenum cofactor biosynthesis protein YqeB [Pelotomaculum propionicicum]|uniref:selenium-dependent molybdenum cofactor biosynthesis protein YqeB n=1 Tax=Pelotomaculum propionicicum TaxID=258475 RepID=UPI003B7B0346
MNCAGRLVVIKGAGDLATGCAWRLFRSGFEVVMTELPQPLVVRRTVAFAEAVYAGSAQVEGVEAVLAENIDKALELLKSGRIPVLVDPEALVVSQIQPLAFIDAVMAKRNTGTKINDAPLVVGLGPGFTAGLDVHAVVETERGHNLGRVLDQGKAAADTGVPGSVMGYAAERLLRAPADGVVRPWRNIGELVKKGDTTAFVGSIPLKAEISGIIRGMIKPGVWVARGTKIGDIDPRGIIDYCFSISDKALAVGGGVLEAVCRCFFRKEKKGSNNYENYGSLELNHGIDVIE